ncbi:MAG: hypothetical protein ACHP85_00825 [Burkholderiales bacterium]|jgi:hypothetical protein
MRLSAAIGGLLSAWLCLATPAAADDAQRIQELEGEVGELKRELQDLKLLVGDVTQAQATPPAVQDSHEAMHGFDSTQNGFHTPTLSLRGYGNVNYDSDWVDHDGGNNESTNHFTTGGLDLFITSQISEKLRFLNETVFEFEEGGEAVLDVERLLVQYDYADWLRPALGRGHTALGYWNHRFHHGSFTQTTVERPLLYRFEDDGGIMPVHFVGLEASGDVDVGESYFSYAANLANGRGDITDFVQMVEDQNEAKAFAFMLTFHPTGMEELGFGANTYIDRIPKDPDTPGREDSIEERIFGVHAYYTVDPFELIVEGQALHHDSEVGGVQWSYGAYAQVGYSLGRIKPYYRFDLLGIDPDDAYFMDLPGVENTLEHTVGFRYDWTTFASTKLEFRRRDSKTFDAFEAAASAAFAF